MTYEKIIFVQGDEAQDLLDMIEEKGESETIDYLCEYDCGGNEEDSCLKPWGKYDEVFEESNYILIYNHSLQHVGLIYRKSDELTGEKCEQCYQKYVCHN